MIPDFRSSEVTFDLLSQVAGRSAEVKKKEEFIFKPIIKIIMQFGMRKKIII